MVPMVSYCVLWCLLLSHHFFYSIQGVRGVLQSLMVSVVVSLFFYSVRGVRGAYGVLQCLVVSVVVPLLF